MRPQRQIEIRMARISKRDRGSRVAVFQRTASYATTCLKCGGAIRPGDRILWSSADERAKHQVCPKPTPAAGSGEPASAPGKVRATSHRRRHGEGMDRAEVPPV